MIMIQKAETEIVYNQKPQIHSGITIVDRPINQYMEKRLSSKEVNSVNPLQIVVMFISIAWVIGMIVMLGFLIYSWIRIKNQVKTAIPRDVAGVRIYQSEQIATSFLFGLIKPKIYIPFSVAEDDLTYVVLHEQAHYRRCDYLIKPIAYILLMIYWFQPLLWVAYVLLCRDIELACDELVIRESDKEQSFRKMYSQALLSCAVNRKMISACPIAFGEVGVKVRVKNVLSYKKPTFWMLVVIVVVCIAIPACFMTHKKEEPVVAKQQEWSEEIQAQELTVLEQQIEEIEIQKKAEIHQLNQMRKTLAAKKSELTGKIDVEAPGAEQQLQLLEERFEELEAMLQQMESDITGIKEISQNENASYIEQWAEVFCNRDGETIALMAAEDAENSFYIVKMNNDEIAKISVSAVCKKYEQEGEFVYFKERFLSEALTGILTGDAASGFCIIQENDGERPTLIVKTYLSGVEGHSDCIGYAMTKLRLQDDGTWQETYQFLPV